MSLQKVGVPTIVINYPWCGDEFNAFIQTIEQPAVILFDEFEKNYKREVQEQLLTLLDGVFPSKKLFMLTCNDQHRIDSHMRNRPGRIYYFVKFQGLAEEFMEEYCQDNLADQQYIEKIVQISKMYGQFNFDMLQSLVEEMNRFDEDPVSALEMLNAKPEEDSGGRYAVQLIYAGLVYAGKDIDEGATFTGNPLMSSIEVGVYVRGDAAPGAAADENDENDENDGQTTSRRKYESFDFVQEDFVRFDPVNGQFVFQNEKAMCILTLIRERSRHNMLAF